MSGLSSIYGNAPGMGPVLETYEAAFTWGPPWRHIYTNGLISASAIDPGNTPTYKLRQGLVLGQITASGLWTNYSPTATDGSQIAKGVLVTGMRMQDVYTGLNTQKWYAILVAGGLQTAKLLGLDQMAQAQMTPFFQFDQNLAGANEFEFSTFLAKTANYQILASDNFTEFTNLGAVGAVTLTLPAILPGYKFGFRVYADQNLTIASFEGGNIVALNNAAASSLAFQTGSQRIGGGLKIYSNQAGTKWEVDNMSAGTNAITVA